MFTLLLEYVMRNAGMPLTRQMTLEHVWDINTDQFTNTVEVHILFLRRKLAEASSVSSLKQSTDTGISSSRNTKPSQARGFLMLAGVPSFCWRNQANILSDYRKHGGFSLETGLCDI